jgi:hypothetical protein
MGSDGIDIWILGDFGPFSRTGKSIGYQVSLGRASFLIDCGSPLFNIIGGHSLKAVDGLVITHCHDDHKRWFSDLALFHRYAPDINEKVFLIASEDVQSELVRACGPSIDRSLSDDSTKVIDIAFEEYVETRIIGPRARYKIASGGTLGFDNELLVVDEDGNTLGPERAKVVISNKTGRPRMLFKDPDIKEWVEPECFYPYSSDVFYGRDKGRYEGDGYVIEAVKAPVWHGIPGIGLRLSNGSETLFITSDTVHDLELWKKLSGEKRPQRLTCSREEFESLSVIYGDINDYIERMWSQERYLEAMKSFEGAVVLQDASLSNSVVHTDYVRLGQTVLKREMAILTHCPDRMTSEWVLCYSGKKYRVKGDKFYELVDEKLFPINADVFHKEGGKFYVGYRNENGKFKVLENNNALHIQLNGTEEGFFKGEHIYSVDLYEDISGEYFPVLDEPDSIYLKRGDGKVEVIEFTEGGSSGKVIENHRDRLCKAVDTDSY